MGDKNSAQQTKPMPLEGLKVLECGVFHAGPGAAAILGDLGADVVKIESGMGDPIRKMNNIGTNGDITMPNGESAMFQVSSRNKRGACIDIKTDKGKQIFLRLVKGADVLVVKPMLAGGLRRARQVIALSHAAGLQAVVTSTIDSGVGVAAALHLAATLPAPAMACGLATGSLLVADLLAAPLVARNGVMVLPGAPGLGVAIDVRQVAQYSDGWHGVR